MKKLIYAADDEQDIICDLHNADDVKLVNIGQSTLFIKAEMYDVRELGFERDIAYVDVTGIYKTVDQINIVFLFAALSIGLGGSIMGFFTGRRLEQNQLVQKQFFENTTHELKTPLTAIRGYAEGIEKGVITDYVKTGKVIHKTVQEF